MNENFDKLITFPKVSTWYQFFLSIIFRKHLMSPWFEEVILEFALLKFSRCLCYWHRSCLHVYFCVFSLFCFFSGGNDGGTGDRCYLSEIFSVSSWFVFCLRAESCLSKCRISSFKILLFFVSVYWLIDVENIFLRDWMLFNSQCFF